MIRSKRTSDSRNLDLLLFTSNIVFSQVATIDMNTEIPDNDVTKLFADDVLLKANYPERLNSRMHALCYFPKYHAIFYLIL